MTNQPDPTDPSSPETAAVRPPAPLEASGGCPAASDASTAPQAPVQPVRPVADPSGGPEAPQTPADAESPADAAQGRQAGAQTPRQGTDGGRAVTAPLRVLVTGSRAWHDRPAVETALLDAWHDALELGAPGIVVVHGAAMGADRMAAQWAARAGVPWEAVPADWDRCADDCPPGHRRERGGREWCPTAGHRRNQAMVNAGAAVCLAFVGPCTRRECPEPRPHGSHGATDCAERAEAAGIPVHRWTR